MPDWMQSTLNAYPALIWVFGGMGLPWALVVLPRHDWSNRVMVACLSLAFGPALLTVWMFILGTLGMNDDPDAGATINPMQTSVLNHVGGTDWLQPGNILAGTVVIAGTGLLLAWIKARRRSAPVRTPSEPLAPFQVFLLALIVVSLVGRWIITSWLSFGAYDPLWVYGYQGRIYTLLGYIPADIGYYPQFLPLQYAYTQIVSAGGIDDHAARAVLPFLQIGSILATYILGSRLFNRNTGLVAAALWALYYHFGYWTRVGDLEIPVAFLLTGAAAFYLVAWTEYNRRYAVIAGLLLSIALWTKPTAGALVWGVILTILVEWIRVRDLRIWRRRFEIAFITGLATIPLGGLWYVRNILIGHEPVNFPPPFWLTQAMRSGAEFGWPLLALVLLLLYVYVGPVRYRPNIRPAILGVGLVVLGLGRTIMEPARMNGLEWLLFIAGIALLALLLTDFAFAHITRKASRQLAIIGWASLLALPYFVTWFYSYSYHYRLSFAIVPIMLLPSAVILAHWFTPERVATLTLPLKTAFYATILLVSLPGVGIAIYDEALGWDWLWHDDNEPGSSLLDVVDTLETYIQNHDAPLIVAAPGLQPLPFFFPLEDIRVAEVPYDLDQIADATHFIDSSAARRTYEPGGIMNPVFTNLRRENAASRVATFHDPESFYDVYELHLERRFERPEVEFVLEDEVIFGGFVRLIGYSYNTDTFAPNGERPVELYFLWEVLDEVAVDYMIYVHLLKESTPNTVWATRDGPVNKPIGWELNYYSTLFWEPGEYIVDRRGFYQSGAPADDDYYLRLGFYNLGTGERIPVTINGAPAGDGYRLDDPFAVAE